MKYISRIILKNIRGFKNLNIDVDHNNKNEHASKTIIIGENGTCKTTLLRCIAIGLCEQPHGTSLISENSVGKLISEDSDTASITIYLRKENGNKSPLKITTVLGVDGDNEYVTKKFGKEYLSDLFVTGFGAGRSSEGPDPGGAYRIIDAVYTLFRYDETLLSTELALYRLKDYLDTTNYHATMANIFKALNLPSGYSIEPKIGGGVIVKGPDLPKPISFESWADGYRLTCIWIFDLYSRAMKAQEEIGIKGKVISKFGNVKGILLIDEIEQHLHPSMQTSLITKISEFLPNIQIFITTHSPFVALAAKPEELVVLKRDGEYVNKVEPPNFRGYSIEDMLVSERLFDIGPPYSPDIKNMLKEYRELKNIPKDTLKPKEKIRLKMLANELLSQQIIETEDDQLTRLINDIREKYEI